MRESVSILESDINKTIENNDKKLKEEQLKIERILQQKAFTVATSSERSSYDLGVDFVTPIMEMVPEDERIEVIQTRAPIEFNFGETDHTPPVVIAIDDGVDLKEDLPTEGRNGKVRRVPHNKSVAPELIFPTPQNHHHLLLSGFVPHPQLMLLRFWYSFLLFKLFSTK